MRVNFSRVCAAFVGCLSIVSVCSGDRSTGPPKTQTACLNAPIFGGLSNCVRHLSSRRLQQVRHTKTTESFARSPIRPPQHDARVVSSWSNLPPPLTLTRALQAEGVQEDLRAADSSEPTLPPLTPVWGATVSRRHEASADIPPVAFSPDDLAMLDLAADRNSDKRDGGELSRGGRRAAKRRTDDTKGLNKREEGGASSRKRPLLENESLLNGVKAWLTTNTALVADFFKQMQQGSGVGLANTLAAGNLEFVVHGLPYAVNAPTSGRQQQVAGGNAMLSGSAFQASMQQAPSPTYSGNQLNNNIGHRTANQQGVSYGVPQPSVGEPSLGGQSAVIEGRSSANGMMEQIPTQRDDYSAIISRAAMTLQQQQQPGLQQQPQLQQQSQQQHLQQQQAYLQQLQQHSSNLHMPISPEAPTSQQQRAPPQQQHHQQAVLLPQQQQSGHLPSWYLPPSAYSSVMQKTPTAKGGVISGLVNRVLRIGSTLLSRKQ